MSLSRNIVLPPDDDTPLDPSWTSPLESVERAIRGLHRYRHFELGDFMIMCRVLRRPRPDLVLSKHYWTRRYLNLDAAGHAYRYFPPKDPSSTRSGQYRLHKDITRAMDQLDLWDLPWMKPGLEADRFGLSWQERWVIHPDELGDDTELGAVGRYRLECQQWDRDHWMHDDHWPEDAPWPEEEV